MGATFARQTQRKAAGTRKAGKAGKAVSKTKLRTVVVVPDVVPMFRGNGELPYLPEAHQPAEADAPEPDAPEPVVVTEQPAETPEVTAEAVAQDPVIDNALARVAELEKECDRLKGEKMQAEAAAVKARADAAQAERATEEFYLDAEKAKAAAAVLRKQLEDAPVATVDEVAVKAAAKELVRAVKKAAARTLRRVGGATASGAARSAAAAFNAAADVGDRVATAGVYAGIKVYAATDKVLDKTAGPREKVAGWFSRAWDKTKAAACTAVVYVVEHVRSLVDVVVGGAQLAGTIVEMACERNPAAAARVQRGSGKASKLLLAKVVALVVVMAVASVIYLSLGAEFLLFTAASATTCFVVGKYVARLDARRAAESTARKVA